MSLRLLILPILLFTFGCATNPNLNFIVPSKTLVDQPSIGEITTAELGNTILSKGEIYENDAIRTFGSVTNGNDGVWLLRITVAKGVHPLKYIDANWNYYSGPNVEVYDALAGSTLKYGGLRVSRNDLSKVQIYIDSAVSLAGDPSEPVKYELTKARAVDQPSFVQELIYNGRVQDNLRFVYREFSNDLARPAFSQEAHYDLSEGNVLGFKGVRIEVLEATNTFVRYRVLKTFPDPKAS